jgi:hypothetical protein
MIITESRLKWDGKNLYRIRGPHREFVGTIVRSVHDPGRWIVWMATEIVGRFATLDEAKAFLERIA